MRVSPLNALKIEVDLIILIYKEILKFSILNSLCVRFKVKVNHIIYDVRRRE
jgi:hypothetical protein